MLLKKLIAIFLLLSLIVSTVWSTNIQSLSPTELKTLLDLLKKQKEELLKLNDWNLSLQVNLNLSKEQLNESKKLQVKLDLEIKFLQNTINELQNTQIALQKEIQEQSNTISELKKSSVQLLEEHQQAIQEIKDEVEKLQKSIGFKDIIIKVLIITEITTVVILIVILLHDTLEEQVTN